MDALELLNTYSIAQTRSEQQWSLRQELGLSLSRSQVPLGLAREIVSVLLFAAEMQHFIGNWR